MVACITLPLRSVTLKPADVGLMPSNLYLRRHILQCTHFLLEEWLGEPQRLQLLKIEAGNQEDY